MESKFVIGLGVLCDANYRLSQMLHPSLVRAITFKDGKPTYFVDVPNKDSRGYYSRINKSDNFYLKRSEVVDVKAGEVRSEHVTYPDGSAIVVNYA